MSTIPTPPLLDALDEGTGPVVVLLHGLPLDRRMWRHQVRALAPHYRVIVPDLRGFGRSAHLVPSTTAATAVTTMDDMAGDVLTWLDARGITEPVTLGGLSMGGYVTFALLRRAPERVSRVILSNTRTVADAPEAAANRLTLAEKVIQGGPSIIAEAMLPKLFGPKTNEDRADVVDEVRHLILIQSSSGIAAAQRGLAQRPAVSNLAELVRAPTLVLSGSGDQISPPAEMEGWAQQIPGSRFVTIANAGHMAPLEQPEAYNRQLLEFLSASRSA